MSTGFLYHTHNFYWSEVYFCYFDNVTKNKNQLGQQGWRSGESARLSPVCPRFDYRSRRRMWVEFVVGSLLCPERFFSGYSGFPVSSKTNIYKFHFDTGMQGHFKRVLVNSWCSVGKQITVTFPFPFTFTFSMEGNVKSE